MFIVLLSLKFGCIFGICLFSLNKSKIKQNVDFTFYLSASSMKLQNLSYKKLQIPFFNLKNKHMNKKEKMKWNLEENKKGGK